MIRSLAPLSCLLLFACAPPGATDDDDDAAPVGTAEFENFGDNSKEGHTPRGFSGQGTGLFVGDNINGGFPEGDGVQTFLTFDLTDGDGDDILDGNLEGADLTVHSAVLTAADVSINGSPFDTLGDLLVEHVEFEDFGRDLFNLDTASDEGCVLADSEDGPFECDLAGLVQAQLDSGRMYVQMRILTEIAGDSDSTADMIVFNPDDSNTDEPGLFSLTVSASVN